MNRNVLFRTAQPKNPAANILPAELELQFSALGSIAVWGSVIVAMLTVGLSDCLYSQETEPGATDSDFVSLFDGETLNGWSGDEPYWSIRAGAILGQITEETRIKANHFLIYQGDIPADFELVAEYRISARGNSGINYRSEVVPDIDFHALRGYQCDIDGQNRYTGSNYEERRRTTLASIGQSVVIPEVAGAAELKFVEGNRWAAGICDSELSPAVELARDLLPDQWHEVRIVARGNVLEHYIDGQLMSKVVDNDPVNRRNQGRLGVQVHVGPPMTIEYRKLRVRALQ